MRAPHGSPDDERSPAPLPRRHRVLLAVLFAVAVAAFVAVRLGPSLLGLRVFAGTDVFALFPPWSAQLGAPGEDSSRYVTDQFDSTFPAMHEMRERLLDGGSAAWSSMVAGGFALLGTINYGMISPGRWLFLLLPTWLAPAWSKLVELAFAGAFAYLFARRLRLGRLPAALAGFVYPLTGFLIGWTNWPQTAVATIIPMAFWAVERFLQERRVRHAVPVALATALLVLGGFPAVAGQTLYMLGGYALVRAVAARRSFAALRDLAVLLVAVLLGLALSAVQLFPFAVQTLGEVDLSYRSVDFFRTVPEMYLLTSIFPESFAVNGLSDAFGSPIDLNSYVGGVVLLLAALGLLQLRRMRGARSAVVYLLLVVVLAVGLMWFQGAWSAWMNNLPVFNGNPIGRMRSQLGLPAAVLAGLGLQWVLHVRGSRDGARGREAWLGAGAAAGVTAAAAVAGWAMLTGRVVRLSDHVARDVTATLVPMVVVTLALVLLAALTRPATRTLVVALALVAVVAQAVPATRFYWPTGERAEFYPVTPGIELLQEEVGGDRLATLGHPIRPNMTQYFGLRSLNGHIFVPEAMKEVMTAIDPNSFVGPTYSIFSPDVRQVAGSPGLDRYAVRFLVADAASVLPGEPGVPVPLPGAADDAVPVAAEVPVAGTFEVELAAEDLRGVHVPLDVREPVRLGVEVRRDGETLARNVREVPPTAGLVDVPMAVRMPAGTTGTVVVDVTVEGAGATGTVDEQGRLRVVGVRAPAGGDGLSVAHAADGMIVWERDGYLPRVRWASRATVVEDETERLAAVADSPARAGEVILDEPPAEGFRGTDAGGRLEVEEDSGDVLRVRTAADAAGYVVVSDTVLLDFVATVDGEEVEIVPADHAGGAVLVPAGEHTVELRYSPVEQRVGALVSAGAALVLVAVWALARVRGRRGPGIS